MKEIGILIIINGLVVAGYLAVEKANVVAATFIGLLCFLSGIAVVMSDRLEIVDIPKIGKLKAKVQADAADVAGILTKVEDQAKSITAVMRDALAARQQLAEVERLAAEGERAVKSLQQSSDFATLLLRAQLDDRQAFDELRRLAAQPGSFQTLATNAVWQILSGVVSDLSYMSTVPTWSDYKIDPDTATIDEFATFYATCDDAYQPEIQKQIWQRTDFRQADKIEFLIRDIKDGRSLHALYSACEYVNEVAKLFASKSDHPSHVDDFLKWWSEHKADYEKEPAPKPKSEPARTDAIKPTTQQQRRRRRGRDRGRG